MEEELYCALGIDKGAILIDRGNHSTGFWRSLLLVDLELLRVCDLDAFRVIQDVHDTSGISFREYHGIDITAVLPNGVTPAAIVELCRYMLDNYMDLTEGLRIEFNGRDEVALWENGEANEYWQNFSETVSALDAREVYDMADSENYPYIVEAIEDEIKDEAIEAIAYWLESKGYYQTDANTIYINHEAFAERYVDEHTSHS